MEQVQVDVNLVKECFNQYEKAVNLLNKIQEKIEEFCEKNHVYLLYPYDNPFVPFWVSDEYLMTYTAFKESRDSVKLGYIVIDKDGIIKWVGED
jgi:hypothetical protein